MTKRPGRDATAAWRHVRAQVLREESSCALCGGQLDPSQPRATPWATEVDHVHPLALGGDPYDRANLRAVHRWCHQRRPAVPRPRAVSRWAAAPTEGTTSLRW